MTETEVNAAATTTFRAAMAASPLRYSLSLVGTLVDECRVELAPSGLSIRAMDPATVAGVDLYLDEAAFERYEATGGSVGVRLDRLCEALQMADDDERVELSLRPETRSLSVSAGEFEYTLGLLDPASIRSPPDAIEPGEGVPGRLTVESGTLDRAVTAADGLSDHLTLSIDADDEAFVVEATGDTDSFTLTRSADDLSTFEPTDAESMFSVDYLRTVGRAIRSGTALDVRLGVEQPMYVSFSVADGDGSVRYAVAPRLSTR